jgi:hypothetical protein
VTTDSNHKLSVADNLLQQKFLATAPNLDEDGGSAAYTV